MSDSVTPWTTDHQTSLSMGFSSPEYWSGLPFPSLGDIPDLVIEPTSRVSPGLAGGLFTMASPGKPQKWEIFFFQMLPIHLLITKNPYVTTIFSSPFAFKQEMMCVTVRLKH